MVQASSSVGHTSIDVIRFEVRIVAEDFLPALAGRQEPEHVDDTDSHPADTRSATALVGIDGESIQKVCHRSFHLHAWAYGTRSRTYDIVALIRLRPSWFSAAIVPSSLLAEGKGFSRSTRFSRSASCSHVIVHTPQPMHFSASTTDFS